MKKLKTPAQRPRKAPSNQTGGTAWGKKLAAEFSRMMQSADMKKLILLNFPYIIAFYMVEKAAWLYRHCNGDSVVDRLMVLFMNFGLAYKSVLPSFHPFDLMVGLVGAAALKAVIYFKGKKYFVKMWIAVYLVSHTFDIAMAVFDIGQSVVNSSSGIIRGNTAIDISSLSMQMQAAMATMAIGELVTLALETLVVSWCLKILSVVITVIMYGRMIEIYLYTSLAPIPFATMSNREWGHVGTNYFRGLFALAFQAFLMMVCVAIYAALIGSIRVSSDIHSALFGTMAYTVIL